MPIFRYQALNADNQLVAGHVAADAVAQAIAQLEATGLRVQSIGFAPPDDDVQELGPTIIGVARSDSQHHGATPDSAAERSLLESHLASVLEQSRPLLPALRAYAEEMPDNRRKRELQDVCHIIQMGDASEAVRDLAALPEYWIPLLSSAGPSNDAGRVLRGFLDESRLADALAGHWRRALIYPCVIVLMALTVLGGFALIIVPQFKEIYYDFDFEVSRLTVFIMNAADAFADGTLLKVTIAVACAAGFVYLFRRWIPESIRSYVVDRVTAIFGRSTAVAQFTRFSAELLEAGLDVPRATRIAASASRRPSLRTAGWQLAHALETDAAGIPYHSARRLTATAIHALRTPISPSARVALLKELSLIYARRAERKLSWTRGIFEPLAIMVVGLIVGIVVLALFIPLIDLINNLSG
jgi:type IV pilus assembly protein PilC